MATTQTVLVEPNTRLSLFNWFSVGRLLLTLGMVLHSVYKRTQSSLPPMTYGLPILRCARLLLLAGAFLFIVASARATASFVCDGMIKRNTSVFPMKNCPTDLGIWAKAGHTMADALPYANLVSRTQ